jgi:hypothetical protein
MPANPCKESRVSLNGIRWSAWRLPKWRRRPRASTRCARCARAGTRFIPWSDLSRRAHELPHIVDECVAAVETALGLRDDRMTYQARPRETVAPAPASSGSGHEVEA